jgi:uncharacterized protein (TIGR00288 family)
MPGSAQASGPAGRYAAPMTVDEERIALFIDYENLAIGSRERLGIQFEFGPIADALAERGRVVVRRAYGDWTMFEPDRKMLTRHHVELIEIPQRMGGTRKNAADIKMAVDAMEMAFERDYLTTFVFVTGDSDFTPLVHKLREHDKRVIGVGIKASTSLLLPPACDEFLFYENLEGVEPRKARKKPKRREDGEEEARTAADIATPGSGDVEGLERLVLRTLPGLQSSAEGPVLASALKRALLRKDPTFSEADFGFRAFGELLRFLAERKVLDVIPSQSRGDPEVTLPEQGAGEERAFRLLAQVCADAETETGDAPALSGLKNKVRKREPEFSEKSFGYGGFLQFCKAAAARDFVILEWDDEYDDYFVRAP